MQMTDVTGRGGAEKALVDLALHLDRRRFNVSVCATRSAGNYQPLLDAAGVPSIILERNSRWDAAKLGGLVQLLRKQRIHVLHTHLFGTNTWGRLLGKLAGVPVIIAHEHWSSKAEREVWVDRLLYRLSDRIIVPSEASKQLVMEIEHIPARYLTVVYNGVDLTKFAPQAETAAVREELGLPPDAIVIGSVGRLSADKGGQDGLIRAVAEVRQTHPQVRLVFVGDGPLRVNLEALVFERGLGEVVHFTGQRADVARMLGAFDIFVLPSLREALPIAVIEAMAVRLPVVAARIGGIPEVVEDGATGCLVPPGDEAALAAVLARLGADPDLAARLGAAGQARVQAQFTVEQMVRRVEQLYDDLARRKIRRKRR
jgi:glycosyltransferase involved in cell wall biosynthesis